MMSLSIEKFDYNSLDELKLGLTLRKEIINASIGLNNSELSFSSFNKSKCNPKYWYRTDEGGFMLKEGAVPSSGVNDIFINGNQYATECATAIMIVYYKALLSIFGKKLFNKQFPKIYLMDWNTETLISDMISMDHVSTLLLGDGGYFSNPDFDPKTPEWQGENVIVLPNGMYYGHGIGIVTAEDIISALNSKRKNGAAHSAYLDDTVNRLDIKKLNDIYKNHIVQTAPFVWKSFPLPISMV